MSDERVSIPTYPEEATAAEAILANLDSLAADGITIHLGRLSDQDRGRLTQGQATILKQHRLDTLRVLLAKTMIEEAHQIHRMWAGYMDHRTPEHSRRFADLMFSARAMLPPGVPWESVTFLHHNEPVEWSRQLNYDGNGRPVVNIAYSVEDATHLIASHK